MTSPTNLFVVRSSIVPLSKSQPPWLLMFGKCWISLQLEPPIQGDWPPVGLPRHLLPISPKTSPRQSGTTETNPPESSKNFIVTNASFDLRSVMKLVHKLPCCTLHFLLSPISYLPFLKQGNYSLRRPPKLTIQRLFIEHKGQLYTDSCVIEFVYPNSQVYE